ncbi:MAG: PSD1 and planctomycete cytochrome C domain-containing protein [Verrucomicrobiota bacterium]
MPYKTQTFARSSTFSALILAGVGWACAEPLVLDPVDFARDIRPILNAKCTGCHGGVKQAGGVSFVYRDQVIDYEGKSGLPVVVPGNIDESEMLFRITLPSDDDEVMPPVEDHPEGLTDEEVALITRWIEEGASWKQHWSFEKPERPELPTLSEAYEAIEPIDFFIRARLEHEGLMPSERARPGRLLRRIALDLNGIPPSLEELDAFELAWSVDPRAAVESEIDERLGRESFGEKWATMWLDLIRYADSRGLGQDGRRTIWPYRDWVIGALNDDLPFDEFSIKQLAGDLLPEPKLTDLIATAAHRNTQTNNEGGTDDEEFRIEAVVDRVNTTWQTWGAMTFGCVQCHDHPYEEFRHDEYYEFMALFNNTADNDLRDDAPLLSVPNKSSEYDRAHALDREVAWLQEDLWTRGIEAAGVGSWRPIEPDSLTTDNGNKLEPRVVDGLPGFGTAGTISRGPVYDLQYPVPADQSAITGLRFTAYPKDPDKALKDSEWGFEITSLEAALIDAEGNATPIPFAASVADVPWLPHAPQKLIAADGKGFAAYTRMHRARQIVLIPDAPIEAAGKTLQLKIGNKTVILGSFPLVIHQGTLEISSHQALTDFVSDSAIGDLRGQVAARIKERKAIPSTAIPTMAERPAAVNRPTHVFGRGNFLEKEAEVEAGIPFSLELNEEGIPDRLAMAEWWFHPDHPLTARVFVNRLWEQLFGTGIVTTLEDFGSSGEKPSHPELLDYLALRFAEDYDWSIKAILREIMLSETYWQSPVVSSELVERDPANRFLARGPRPRLSAEVLRDQALAISGLLTEKVGGPPVHPPIPEGVWKPFQGGDKWDTPAPGQPDRYRRSIYTYTKRSIPYPTFATFDAPSREFCNPRRLVSNTPLQALVMMNDAVFAEAAAGLARRMKYDSEGTVAERLEQGYRIATSMRPSTAKLDELLRLYEELEARYTAEPELKRGMAGTPDGAAYTIVAQVMLNLDEVITK